MELWDIYDSNKQLTGRTMKRNDWCLKDGEYHLTVLGVVLFALLLNWWDASDRAITAINQVVKFVSILAGVTSALRAGEKGSAMRGACVGVLYMALGIACYCLLMGQSPKLTGYLADLGMGLAAGGLFGMILTARKSA